MNTITISVLKFDFRKLLLSADMTPATIQSSFSFCCSTCISVKYSRRRQLILEEYRRRSMTGNACLHILG